MHTNHIPLTGPPPPQIRLVESPLVRVVAQIRFPVIASIEKRKFIASFQESIRKEYPILCPEQNDASRSPDQALLETGAHTAWRFLDTSEARQITLAPNFLAFETTQYIGRNDFLDRFKQILQALKEHIDPQVFDRLGVRYINRISDNNLPILSQLVRPEVSNILATPLAIHTQHSISENVFLLPENNGKLIARWGLLPAHSTVDPAAVEVIDTESWLLDLDAFQIQACSFEVDPIIEHARGFAERIYSVFRWIVTDEFLRRYGDAS